jgi:hypothetical protein
LDKPDQDGSGTEHEKRDPRGVSDRPAQTADDRPAQTADDRPAQTADDRLTRRLGQDGVIGMRAIPALNWAGFLMAGTG